jgi:hypothetical protein
VSAGLSQGGVHRNDVREGSVHGVSGVTSVSISMGYIRTVAPSSSMGVSIPAVLSSVHVTDTALQYILGVRES